MGHFLEIAKKVLEFKGTPLTTHELISVAIEKNWLRSTGKTPEQTMKAKISTDILINKENSIFMRTDKATFGLKIWKPDFEEFIANRFKKSLLNENAVVFPSSSLQKYISGPGLHLDPLNNSRELLAECKPMLRRLAETDTSFIQLVSVFILKYNELYLSHKRTKRLPENRLHGYYSMFFGGHITPDDIMPLFDIFQPAYGKIFLARELKEEVIIPHSNKTNINYRGLLYDDSKELSRQHLGIVYDVDLNSPEYTIGERGFLMDDKFESLEQMNNRIDEFENWSVFIIKYDIQKIKY